MNKKRGFILGLSIFGMCLVGCGNVDNNEADKIDNLPQHVDMFDDVSTFNTYGETQASYLNDEYSNISKYGKGDKENSKPNSLKINWKYNDINVDNIKNIELTLQVKDSNEEKDKLTINIDKSINTYTFKNLQVEKTYELKLTISFNNDQKAIEDHKIFETNKGNVRFIDIDGLSNVRDCGGWKTADGKRIKQGLLYRGEELNQQNYGKNGNGTIDPDDAVERAKDKPYGQKISAEGIKTFKDELKIKTECDIRGYENFDWATNKNESPTECGGLKNGNGIIKEVNYVINPVHTNRDKIYYDDYGKAAVKNFFDMLADEQNYLPLYFHCAQGKDRTGFLAYLFEAFLGVSREDCIRDYLLSNLGKTGSVSESKIIGSSAQYNYVDYLDGLTVSTQGSPAVTYKAEGDSMAERAYNYLLSCGLTETALDQIRETFLED